MAAFRDEDLVGLLFSAGKSIARAPAAKAAVANLQTVNDPDAFRSFLEGLDLGVAKRAKDAILDAAGDREQWRETHRVLLRSAEQQLIEQYSANA